MSRMCRTPLLVLLLLFSSLALAQQRLSLQSQQVLSEGVVNSWISQLSAHDFRKPEETYGTYLGEFNGILSYAAKQDNRREWVQKSLGVYRAFSPDLKADVLAMYLPFHDLPEVQKLFESTYDHSQGELKQRAAFCLLQSGHFAPYVDYLEATHFLDETFTYIDSSLTGYYRSHLEDGDCASRMAFAIALRHLGDSTAVVDVAKQTLKEMPVDATNQRQARIKVQAIAILERRAVPGCAPLVARHALDSDMQVRFHALAALKKMHRNGDRQATHALKEVLSQIEDPVMREEVQNALNQ